MDMLFIDADKEGYSDYLKKLLLLVRVNCPSPCFRELASRWKYRRSITRS